MPFKIPTEQAAFKFTVNITGQPVGECDQWGTVPYLLCCPLCGMLHQLPLNITPAAVFEPNCIVMTTHPKAYAQWLKRFPEAAEHRQIVTVFRNPVVEIIKPSLPAPSKRRRAA